MKLSLIFTVLLLPNLINASEISQTACKIVSEVLKKENWMKTIAIVKFKNNFEDDVVESLHKCLSMEISTLLIDMKSFNMSTQRIHSPTMTMMVVDEMEELMRGEILAHLVLDYYQKPFLDHNSKFLVLTSNQSPKFLTTLYQYVKKIPIDNFVILLSAFNEILINLSRTGKFLVLSENRSILNEDLYQKLPKQYPNHVHNVLVLNQPPRVKLGNRKVLSKDDLFLNDVVSKVEESEINYLTVQDESKVNLALIHSLLDQLTQRRQYEITLNTFVDPLSPSPRLMTYEEVSYCIMVPKPKILIDAQNILLKPFDTLIWIHLVITIIACTIVWRLGHSSTSYWFVPFFFWGFCHGQSVSFATNRKVFIILLQMLVFMLFVLGNAYQGVITSFIIAPEEIFKLKTLEEFLESNQKLLLGDRVHSFLESNPKYQNVLKNGLVTLIDGKFQSMNFTKLYEDNCSTILECVQAEFNIESGIASNFYLVDEKLFPHFVRLQVIFLSKFIRQWQLLMDWSFEAGLTQAWENMVKMKYNLKKPGQRIMKLNDFSDILYVVKWMFAISLATFCFELLWGNIVGPCLRRRRTRDENLSIKEIQSRKFEFLRRKKVKGSKVQRGVIKRCQRTSKVESPKVRMIQVQPINPGATDTEQ